MRSVVPYGPYLLLDRLAMGGMAELFLAKRTGEAGFEKICVVKRVLPHFAESPEFVRMFLDEARLAARLSHPGIIQVFELGKQDASYYIAMEYLAGTDLVGVLRRSLELARPVPVEIALRIGADAAEALHYAHDFADETGRPQGIVHRDISPSNLFVTCQGTVKVLDFGVALGMAREHRTETGLVKGKASYMSPEQSLAEPVDRRTDVWALGVVLHELLAGKRLFPGTTNAQVALQVCQGPITPLRQLRPDLPEAVEAVVMRALERDLSRRWPSAAALQQALEQCLPAGAVRNPLAGYIKELFGAEWVAAQVARSSLTEAQVAVRSGGTEQLEPPTLLASAPAIPAAAVPRRRPGLAVTLAAALLLALGGAALWAMRSPPAASPSAPAPLAAAPAPKPALPEPAPPPRPEPPKETAPPAPAASRRAAAEPSSRKPAQREPRVKPGAVGRLSLITQPYARVFLKARELGPTPLFDLELPVGRHTLRLLGDDGAVRLLPVEVHEATATQVRVHLKNLALEPKR